MEEEKMHPEVRKIMDQLAEDLRVIFDTEFVGQPFDEKERKIMTEKTVAYFELIGHLDLEEDE